MEDKCKAILGGHNFEKEISKGWFACECGIAVEYNKFIRPENILLEVDLNKTPTKVGAK